MSEEEYKIPNSIVEGDADFLRIEVEHEFVSTLSDVALDEWIAENGEELQYLIEKKIAGDAVGFKNKFLNNKETVIAELKEELEIIEFIKNHLAREVLGESADRPHFIKRWSDYNREAIRVTFDWLMKDGFSNLKQKFQNDRENLLVESLEVLKKFHGPFESGI